MKIKGVIFLILIVFIVFQSCKKEDKFLVYQPQIWETELNLPSNPFNYENLGLPNFYNSNFIKVADNTPTYNPVSNWGATLGRVLFYDKRLSKNQTISCSSCHQQEFGFSDTAVKSVGFLGGVTERHSMGLTNARYYFSKRFFWDERASTLENQVLQPIQDAIEMGMSLDSVVARLQNVAYYPFLFKKAFGTSEIDTTRISYALSQFIRSIVSYRSPFDKGRALVASSTDSFPNFNAQQNRGKAIFFKPATLNCAGCHTTDAFIGDVARNNGMSISTDKGVGDITNNSLDNFTFKTPSLKNVGVRPPYMHNGKFGSLTEVINHYSSGIADHAYLDPHFRKSDGGTTQFNLTAQEQSDLIQFLHTLTDTELIQDEKYGNPFIQP